MSVCKATQASLRNAIVVFRTVHCITSAPCNSSRDGRRRRRCGCGSNDLVLMYILRVFAVRKFVSVEAMREAYLLCDDNFQCQKSHRTYRDGLRTIN